MEQGLLITDEEINIEHMAITNTNILLKFKLTNNQNFNRIKYENIIHKTQNIIFN